ncbi:YggS family pyridoxal phosphate enzyme [Alcanivorax sp. HI0033]|uniref:YggS family pyridoxal phosphate-dependent enzyme n=1 Tax=unclassified Alcanivorax TaxID=2638842 RepID=UPI0007BA9682|nr:MULTISPECIES: YggS family pyridoxal phosphate-dependent enzyme [unclassified Alcanivorax]KZX73257.1 YggS family pyridoxal phosphate enzyme [Alcanivorax sp. HI0011]KZX86767.1 YggS family pyridoxal phosphate enzyme [Alcanivorax sp. HI0013]KZY19607.1 YggS family pyridoxal phosphate enzyme [Alcanivorax sp. HI0035]KZX62124.1 YggS family pyridoxal phosphate enzyme [Alcanivorax sp. HI0003]KZX72351.1 YggS family pyridoxal phosphate enzyme [Alcanivorax sp. HI0007]
MTDSKSPLVQVNTQINAFCEQSGRASDSVQLLAVSKTRTADEVARLADQGQRHFGENYLQEALDKIAALQGKELVWHFIGPIQSNKTRDIAAHFDWVHSVDRLKVARRLSDQRPTGLAPLNVCIQVNVDDEDSKSGIPLDAVPALAEQIAALPNLRLRGLMAIPLANSEDNSRGAFRQLAMTLSQLRNTMPSLDTLSMGMSADFGVAIEEGATIVRVGTALFGPRTP